jgi:ParB/RepB/Spo0J family partition protein
MGSQIRRQTGRVMGDKGRRAVEKLARRLGQLEVIYAPIDTIHPNEYNPNRQSEREFQLLLKSMEEDGFTQPILVQRDTREIVDGEHRWRAASELGYVEVPIVLVDMTPEQMRISTLRHNRARGSEDIDAVSQVLADLQELGALDKAMDSLMLDEKDVNKLLDNVMAADGLANAEYSQAWEPDSNQDWASRQVGDEFRMSKMSAGARDEYDAMQEQVRAAPNDFVRAQIRRDETKYWGFSLTCSMERGARIASFLGPEPAKKILWLAQQEVGES